MAVELDIWAGRLAHQLEQLPPDLHEEAQALLRIAKRHAPGKLGETLSAPDERVVSSVPYAQFTSEGGTIRPKLAQWLRIPLPGQPDDAGKGPGYVTIGEGPTRYVIRKDTRELVAVRKLSVTIRGTHWMEHALREHEASAEHRLSEEGRRRLEGVG